MDKIRSQSTHFERFTFQSEWFSLLTIVTIVGLAIWSYPLLPDMVPSHWNAAGEKENK